ncbi:HD domain-containing protein [Leucobacter sp. cx-169]|uniref:HD domain-containing protein n=1 Tax=Leucobacter sp. cx-169 TaxID=2770549 RepID=UPI00165EB270|nr:HD domain-containing protein [Leucobacter sp. cx-169]MBC9927398.1 bifunctional (p)ppGpp synthetase/guanosine-3',5'-bis(diphosphate) 3'-pyrophosphohydrolase [Leucobacter sp. cx-169]
MTLITFHRLPLKEMDPAMLSFELTREANFCFASADDRRMITDAAMLATHLHRGQTRRVRANMPRVPYIEHPLRVAMRLIRQGCFDADTICAALLHDVVEDCAREIAVVFARAHPLAGTGLTEAALSLAWIEREFTSRVAAAVALVSNAPDVTPADYLPKITELARLAERNGEASDAFRALLVKASDLIDNAGSLGHQHSPGVNDTQTLRLAKKYIPVIKIVRKSLGRSANPVALRAASALIDVERSVARLVGRIEFEGSSPLKN